MKQTVRFDGTPATNEFVRVPCEKSAFLLVEPDSSVTFTAELRHLKEPVVGTLTDSNTSQLMPAITLSATDNYHQTLGCGFFVLKFTAASGNVTVSVTE